MAQREVQEDGTLLPAVARHRYVDNTLLEFMQLFRSSPDPFATSKTQKGRVATWVGAPPSQLTALL